VELVIALEHRFCRTPDGAIWTSTALGRSSWDRYLGQFGEVHLVARVDDVPVRDARWARVDGDGVDLLAVPHFVGPRQYLLRRRQVRRAVGEALALHPEAAVILRVPGTIAAVAAAHLRAARRPFAVEVVGDPQDVFAPGALDHPLRPLLRWWSPRELRRLCREASAALYVTGAALQRRYPTRPGVRTFAASDVETDDEAFVARPRRPDVPDGSPLRLVYVGTLEVPYKRPDLLLEAVARCAKAGLELELAIVGDGRLRGSLEERARRLGVASRVRFVGQLSSGAAVRRELDRADLFVLPSRVEGLPRALVEAMARALPCLATPVGGIPELLSPEGMVASDAGALAARVAQLARDPALRAELSRRNLARAREFHPRALQPIRERFYAEVIAQTQRLPRERKALARRA
jgi:glycosyltransferase involved in cell wall biosynthesis